MNLALNKVASIWDRFLTGGVIEAQSPTEVFMDRVVPPVLTAYNVPLERERFGLTFLPHLPIEVRAYAQTQGMDWVGIALHAQALVKSGWLDESWELKAFISGIKAFQVLDSRGREFIVAKSPKY